MTNFEKIKAMTAEDMADQMCRKLVCCACPLWKGGKGVFEDCAVYGNKDEDSAMMMPQEICETRMLNWLNSEEN